jgi:hypothetical protein
MNFLKYEFCKIYTFYYYFIICRFIHLSIFEFIRIDFIKTEN